MVIFGKAALDFCVLLLLSPQNCFHHPIRHTTHLHEAIKSNMLPWNKRQTMNKLLFAPWRHHIMLPLYCDVDWWHWCSVATFPHFFIFQWSFSIWYARTDDDWSQSAELYCRCGKLMDVSFYCPTLSSATGLCELLHRNRNRIDNQSLIFINSDWNCRDCQWYRKGKKMERLWLLIHQRNQICQKGKKNKKTFLFVHAGGKRITSFILPNKLFERIANKEGHGSIRLVL